MSIPDWFRTEHKTRHIELENPDRDRILLELDELSAGIGGGWKEREVLEYLKQRPYLLVGRYRSGHGTYAFPELSFGGKYYADWLVSHGHSGGLTWELIELECPQSTPFLQDGHLSEAARKGINQIQDWRNWVQRNLDMAERPIAQEGLGLFDIRPQSFGLVVVGQGSKYREVSGYAAYNKNRKTTYEQNHIKIESYENFIDSLKFRYNKPPYR